jgi:hypothetical protein
MEKNIVYTLEATAFIQIFEIGQNGCFDDF